MHSHAHTHVPVPLALGRFALHCCQGPGWQGYMTKRAPAHMRVRLGRKDAMLTIVL